MMRLSGSDVRRLRVLLLERSADGERMRNRSASVAAVALLLVGLLVALGYGGFAVAVVVAVVVAAAAVTVTLLLQERWAWPVLRAKLSGAGRPMRATVRSASARGSTADVRVHYERAWLMLIACSVSARARWRQLAGWPLHRVELVGSAGGNRHAGRAAVWPVRAEAVLGAAAPWDGDDRVGVAARLQRLLGKLERSIGQAAREAGLAAPAGSRVENGDVAQRNHDALSRNALGAQLRRSGQPDLAVEQHRAAQQIFAEIGNCRGEALAANNLALALAEGGDHEAALARLEQARALLQRLGDHEREGKVIANIGYAKQRAGRSDEAAELLRAALEKLEPETPAYRLVERTLRRAS